MRALLCACLTLLSMAVKADCLDSTKLTGVNLAGAEFNAGAIPGKLFVDYVYPGTSTLDYFRLKGVNLIRLPILWERYQPEPFSSLDTTNTDQLRRIIEYARQYDLCIWIDLHNYAKYQRNPLTQYANPSDMLSDFWQKINSMFSNDQAYWALGLMNEPAAVSRQEWANIAQATVNSIRTNGINGLVIVSGGDWSGAHSWFSGSASNPSNATLFAGFTDPISRMTLDIHQYADSDYSGTKTDCVDHQKMDTLLSPVADWARQHNKSLIMGEFGVPPTESCLSTLGFMLSEMQEVEWSGWAYWAAGSWWGNYPLSIHPKNGEDKPQMAVLLPYLN